MPAPRCSPPKGQGVRAYTRAAPGKRRRRATVTKPARAYWTCVNGRNGHTCGVHHATSSAAYRHARRLNRDTYRRGGGRPWDPQKRG